MRCLAHRRGSVLRVLLLSSIVFGVHAAPASATTYYVAPLSTSCSPSAPGAGTIGDPWTNLFYALTQGSLQPGDTLMLRAGTYRSSYSGFALGCSISTGGINTVLPINKAGVGGQPIVIENYPNEIAILDGTDADMLTAKWTACGDGGWQNADFNVGRARTPQFWSNPQSPDDPGARLAFDDSTGSCAGMRPQSFRVASDGRTLFVRLPGDQDPNKADLHMACQNGDCAAYPIHVVSPAAFVVVKRNSSGGGLYVKYGYYDAYVDGGAHDIVFDGVSFIGAGGRDYGQCVRTINGNSITVKNGTCSEVMGEGIAFYGGGPGDQSNGLGINITGNVALNMDVHDTGLAYIDLGGAGDNLGMGVILKNCSSCAVIGNRIHNTVGPAIHVTTSSNAGMQSIGVSLDSNEIFNFAHRCPPPCRSSRTLTAINIEPQTSGAGGAIQSVSVSNNVIHNDGFAPNRGEVPEGIVVSDSGFTPVAGTVLLNNSFNHLQGVCIDLSGAASVVIVENNAMARCSESGSNPVAYLADPQTAHVHDHNAYWSANDGDIVVTRGDNVTRGTVVAAWEDSAVVADPLFSAAGNLVPLSGSPLINAGTNARCPRADFSGGARAVAGVCDVGAFESGSTPARTPSSPANLRIVP